ncbi:MAG: aldo/keto reductase [Rhizobiaceae bacterium]
MPDLKTLDETKISALCFGTMQFGGGADDSASNEMYDASRDAGINFFDTAYAYTNGRSEEFLGLYVQSERESVYIATKADYSCPSTGENILRSCDDSRKRLGVDQIDGFYLHRWDGETPLEVSFEALAELQSKGVIRHIGVSNFAAWQAMKALAVAREFGTTIDLLQPMYNLVKRQAEVEILPMAIDQDIAVASYSPLGGGLLSGKYASGEKGRLSNDQMYAARYSPGWMHETAQSLCDLADEHKFHPATLAVAWAARHPGVTAPIISARSAAQLAPSLAAAGFQMNDTFYEAISAISITPPPATDRLEEA